MQINERRVSAIIRGATASRYKKKAVKMAHEFGPTDSTSRNALQMNDGPLYPLFSNFSASLALQS
jgi:hypothetical protein